MSLDDLEWHPPPDPCDWTAEDFDRVEQQRAQIDWQNVYVDDDPFHAARARIPAAF